MENKINQAVITSALSPDDIAEIALRIIDGLGKNYLGMMFLPQYSVLEISKYMKDRGCSNEIIAELICSLSGSSKGHIIMCVRTSTNLPALMQGILPIKVLGVFLQLATQDEGKFLDIL